MTWIKKLFFALFSFCLLSIFINLFWFYTSRDFTTKHFKPPVSIATKTPLQELADSTYTYLDHGKQSIVFESLDHKTVLKLFYWKRPLRKKWYRHPENWIRFASPSWIHKTLIKKREIKALFERYEWAKEELKEETGVVGTHFCKTEKPMLITIIDRGGKFRRLDLSTIPFIIQKKAKLVPEFLSSKLHARDIEGAKKAVIDLRELLYRRIEKGYVDTRQVFKKNYGFIDDLPIQIDIGKIERGKNMDVEKEKAKVESALQKYLKKHFPSIL